MPAHAKQAGSSKFDAPSTTVIANPRANRSNSVPITEYPLYWGGPGHKGHFEFVTLVMDLEKKKVVQQLRWGMLIDYPLVNVDGHQYFYK